MLNSLRIKKNFGQLLAICLSFLLIGSFFGVSGLASSHYDQAPILDERVEAGQLPPVSERLPDDPKVVEPLEEIGEYGGTINKVYTGQYDFWGVNKSGVQMEPFWQVTQSVEAEPNLIKSWEFVDNVLKLTVRKGLKWSDGEPFTIDDVIYTFKTAPLEDANPTPPSLVHNVKAGEIEKIDKYSARFPLEKKSVITFSLKDADLSPLPEHYFKQYDPRHNDDMTWGDFNDHWPRGLVSEDWVGVPQLSPWVITEVIPGQRAVATRNPYYFKVDPEGNQLPYIDKVVFKQTDSPANIPTMAKAGEIDLQARHVFFGDYSFYKQNEEQGNYTTKILTNTSLGPTIHLNFGAQDKALRELFRNKKFRMALSLAIDREDLNRTFYKGQAEPWGFCPLKESSIYPGDAVCRTHTEYDPERAKELLDEIGVEDTDGDGLREYGDGKDLTIITDMDQSGAGGPVQVLELIAPYMREIGIEMVPNPITRSSILTKWRQNDFEAFAWKQDSAIQPFLAPYYWSTTSSTIYGNVGFELFKWFNTDGEEGIEPPEFVKEINSLMVEARSTLDPEQRVPLGKEMMSIAARNLYSIPTTTLADIGIVNKNLANVPDTWVMGDALRGLRVIKPWQFYYEN